MQGRLGDRHRDLEPEGRTFVDPADDPDLASLRLDDPLADGQTEAGAAVLARDRGVALGEAAKDGVDHLGRHADALIAHGDAQAPAVAIGALPELDLDLASGGELDGVRDEIEQHLPQPCPVAEQGPVQALGDGRQGQALGGGLAGQE